MGRSAHLSVCKAHPEPSRRRTTIPRVPPRLRLLGVLLACVLVLAGAAQAAPRSDQALSEQLARALRAPGVPRSSALAVELATGRIVFAHNARLPLIPASNEKLAVTYAALVSLGPVYRIETQVLGRGEQVGPEWRGDLVLKGFGDPTLSSLGVRRLAAEVRSSGIKVVTGRILGDESYFDSFRTAPGWKPHFFINESPPLSALTVDRGRYLGRTSRTPALAAALLFRKALSEAGVRVVGPAKVGAAPAEEQIFPVAALLSPPLSSILKFMDLESDNFTAEILLKQLGTLESGQGTTALGALAVRRILAEYQLPLEGVRIADGSGLSRLNRLTATDSRPHAAVGVDEPAVPGQLLLFASRRRAQRNPGAADDPHPGGRPRVREDGHDARVLGALGDREGPVRLLDPPERLSGRALGGAPVARPLRGDPRGSLAAEAGRRSQRLRRRRAGGFASSSRARSCSFRIGTSASRALLSFVAPGSSPTITPEVFFETEPATLAPRASSSEAACSRVQRSSVPVIT